MGAFHKPDMHRLWSGLFQKVMCSESTGYVMQGKIGRRPQHYWTVHFIIRMKQSISLTKFTFGMAFRNDECLLKVSHFAQVQHKNYKDKNSKSTL